MIVLTRDTSNMRILRLFLAAYFLFLSAGSCCEAWLMPGHNSSLSKMYLVSLRSTFVALTVIFALGAWNAWRERASMNLRRIRWSGAASLMSLVIGLGIPAIAYFWGDKSNFWYSNRDFAVPAVMGVLGLTVFRGRGTPSKAVAAAT
jgi:hypothetical protein